MKTLIFGLLILGLTTQIYAQNSETMEPVYIVHNYKYLSDVNAAETAIPVEELHLKVSDFSVEELDVYADEHDFYDVYFFIPEGKILASYDKDSNLLSTVERYKDIDLPPSVLEALETRFPNWSISKNVYLVDYKDSRFTKQLYKLTLENNDKRIKVKVNENGVFL